MTAAELSRLLFSPVTIVLYVAAMGLYLYAMAFTRVDRGGEETAAAGSRALWLATGVAVLGAGTHLAHLVARSIAAGGRVPWGNMFEFSSVMGFGVVVAGLVIFQWRMRRPEVVGFLLLGALLSMGAALLVYSEPGPLMPILESQWMKIHVLAIMTGATIFTVGFVFTALYLLRDVAESRVADGQVDRTVGSTVGAARAGALAEEDDEAVDSLAGVVSGHQDMTRTGDGDVGDGDVGEGDMGAMGAYGVALRSAISPVRLFAWTWLVTGTLSWMWLDVTRFVAINTVVGVAALIAWWFLPSLPSAATLDSLAYRTIAFGFPIWTFGVLAGAIWAEQSWGRYWGWDPKETSAFLTWVGYAGYLHTRATKGWRGRKAAVVGLVAFGILLFTYFAVNLLITGLHSYANLG